MEIMTTSPVDHNKEVDLSGRNSSSWEDYNLEDDDWYSCDFGYDYKLEQHTHPFKIMNLVIYSLVLVLGVLGNGVVIWVTGFKMKKTVSTVWYLNLAVADFLVAATLPLGITLAALGHWPFGNFMCKVEGTVFYLNMYASIYTLVVISVDRCVCVVCPAWAQNHRSVRKASLASLGVWVLALALSLPYFIFRDTRPSPYEYDVVQCYNNYAPTGDYTTREQRSKVYELVKFRFGAIIISRFVMGFVVPFPVIVSCYSVIIYRLRKNCSLASPKGRGRANS